MISRFFLGSAALLASSSLAQVTPPEVTVRARKLPVKPIRDAIGYFERHCIDASRLTKNPSAPLGDRDWHELTAAEREGFGLGDRKDEAFGSTRADGQRLALTLAEAAPYKGLIEKRCTLTVVGGEQRHFAGRVAGLLHGPGTQRHIGDPDGVPRLPGWRQLLWAAIPAIRSPQWRVWTTDRGGETWVRVVDPIFYAAAESVVVDLRMRETGVPLTVLRLIYTRKRRVGDD